MFYITYLVQNVLISVTLFGKFVANVKNVYHQSTYYLTLSSHLQQVVKALDLRDGTGGVKLALHNAMKTGADLRAWAEELTANMWQVSDTCIVAKTNPSDCQRLPPCLRTSWSSKSPDTKSEIGLVNSRTGRIR